MSPKRSHKLKTKKNVKYKKFSSLLTFWWWNFWWCSFDFIPKIKISKIFKKCWMAKFLRLTWIYISELLVNYINMNLYYISCQICNGYLMNLIEYIHCQILGLVQKITWMQKKSADKNKLKVDNYKSIAILNAFQYERYQIDCSWRVTGIFIGNTD